MIVVCVASNEESSEEEGKAAETEADTAAEEAQLKAKKKELEAKIKEVAQVVKTIEKEKKGQPELKATMATQDAELLAYACAKAAGYRSHASTRPRPVLGFR